MHVFCVVSVVACFLCVVVDFMFACLVLLFALCCRVCLCCCVCLLCLCCSHVCCSLCAVLLFVCDVSVSLSMWGFPFVLFAYVFFLCGVMLLFVMLSMCV